MPYFHITGGQPMHTPPTLPNLPPSIAREVFSTLCTSLPPPATDTAEARDARHETAMAAVAALHPADAIEALLGVQIVAANAHAMDSLRLAVQPGVDPDAARRCRAQASSMMRQMQSGMRALERRQAAHEKAEAALQPAAMDRAGWWFRDVSMPLVAASPARAEPPAPAAGPHQDPAGDRFAALSEAEQYAIHYPDRAARIRAHGGLPPRLDFGPPEPEIVAALLALDPVPFAAAA
jgi:hypothetical protein